jgi:predicted transcriptional regulator
MKILSLKLDDEIFKETEEITNKIDQARNRYINEAVRIYNAFNKRKLLKQQLSKESKITSKESMDILHEFEKLMDEIDKEFELAEDYDDHAWDEEDQEEGDK